MNIISNHATYMYYLSPIPGDLELDRDIDMVDFAIFGQEWQNSNCGLCGGADLDGDKDVDLHDLAEFINNWLIGVE